MQSGLRKTLCTETIDCGLEHQLRDKSDRMDRIQNFGYVDVGSRLFLEMSSLVVCIVCVALCLLSRIRICL